ncbi:helix-turn-helix domain-containing protein [Niallia sp. BSM11]
MVRMMVELNAKALGEEVKRLRKLNKLSQTQLADGICTQATISGIEAGRGYPSVDILYIISIRLKVTLEYLYKILLNDAEDYIKETEELLEDLMKQKNYKEAYEICQSERKQGNRNLGYKFEQLIAWVHIVSGYYLQKYDYRIAIKELENLLDDDHPLFGQDFIDFRIQNSIAIIYAENSLFQKSLRQYKKILSYQEFLKQQHKFQIKLHYNISKLFFLQKEYIRSLEHADSGIALTKQKEDISMAGQLYFQRGECLEELDEDLDAVKEAYRKSLFIFELLGNEQYAAMVKEQKQDIFSSM